MVRATNADNAMQTLTTKPSSTEVMEVTPLPLRLKWRKTFRAVCSRIREQCPLI